MKPLSASLCTLIAALSFSAISNAEWTLVAKSNDGTHSVEMNRDNAIVTRDTVIVPEVLWEAGGTSKAVLNRYDCVRPRYMMLHITPFDAKGRSLGDVFPQKIWESVAPGTLVETTRRYACELRDKSNNTDQSDSIDRPTHIPSWKRNNDHNR